MTIVVATRDRYNGFLSVPGGLCLKRKVDEKTRSMVDIVAQNVYNSKYRML